MTIHAFELFADYHQFYVWDAGAAPAAPEDYTAEDIRNLVVVAPNVVVVQPVRNMTVPVELELCDADPGFDAAAWDHVAECSLELPTGQLQVCESTGSAVLDVAVSPGCYRVRVLFAGLGSLSDDGLEGSDRYKLVLWPGTPVRLSIAKQWPGP